MSKLVPCKACGKEIAKGVKKCPSCGKDQRSFFGRHKILTFIGGVLVVGGMLGALGGGGDTDTASSSSTETATEEKAEKVYKLNDVVKVDDAEIVVTKLEEKDKVGDEFISKEVSEGGTFVAIQYTIKNVGTEPLGMFSMPTIELQDEAGTSYSSDIDASGNYAVETGVDNSKLLSDLNPDIQVTDTAVYEVSKEKFAQGKWFIVVNGNKIQLK